MKHIISIDVGTNSCGWSLCKEYNNKQIELLDIGVLIFPIGTNVDEKSNSETTKNEQRRTYRGMKRNLFRYKLRRKKLKKLLSTLEMLPDYNNQYKHKGQYQSLDIYKLRSNAIEKKIPLKEIGRIFMLLNKYRGFENNSKKLTLGEDTIKGDENKIVSTSIIELNELIKNSGAKTIGEYFYLMHKKAKEYYKQGKWHNPNEPIDERAVNKDGKLVLYNSRGIRRQFGRYTARKMYQKEFDLIWETQKMIYDKTNPNIFTGSPTEYENIKNLHCKEKQMKLTDFKKTNYWIIRNYCIYYQRPLKSQRQFVSSCQLENNKKVIPASSPLYQEFRIWKNLGDLRYSNYKENIINEHLPLEWKKIIAEYLIINKKVYVSKPSKIKKNDNNVYIIDLIKDMNDNVIISDDGTNEKYIKGNLTYSILFECLGTKKFNSLKNDNKLEKLWHHIYMAKDDEWLKNTLLCKWKLNEATTNKLIEYGLEGGHGSYSAKAIRKILPFMKEEADEFTAKVQAGYLIEPGKITEQFKLKDKISPLKYQELRNPVVEKAVSQTIKIVNAILEKYKNEINREKLEIRIESTRKLKKPRKEREKMLRYFREKDKIRQKYADFLNQRRKEGKLNFNRQIEKYDSVINKYELWLEMGMDEEDSTFTEFEKITNRTDKEKHRLWLECNRICPYTGKIITLTKLFSSEIEIEHIIPLSRSLDNSFNNKTITFSNINQEKGKRTAYEYMLWKNELEDFKKRINSSTNKFSKSKKEQFLKQNINNEFTQSQISNTSYIAKFVRQKMMEISHSVQFTNGMATAELRRNDWKLSNLLDKIRFEEEMNIDNIDDWLKNFSTYRKDFFQWYQMKENSTDLKRNISDIPNKLIDEYEKESGNDLAKCLDIINKFDAFKNKSGSSKDRSDYRHHAIDAFITACCSSGIIKHLSTNNRLREEKGIPLYDEYGKPTRMLINRPFDYEQLKQKIKEILVCHVKNQKLIVSRINKHKTRNGLKEQKVYAPQGPLHKDGLYGKLKEPFLQGINKENVYVKRVPLFDSQRIDVVLFNKATELNKVVDLNLRKVLEKRISKYGNGKKAFSKDSLEKDPIFMYSLNNYPNGREISKKGNALPVVKSVRVINKNSRNLINLPAKDCKGNVIDYNRYVESSGNYMIIYYELQQQNLRKPLRSYKIISFFEAVKTKTENKKLFPDEIKFKNNILGLRKECQWLKQGDLVILYENLKDKSKINWDSKEELSKRLYIVKQISENVTVNKKYGEYYYGNVSLLRANRTSKNIKYPSSKYKMGIVSFTCSHVDLNAIKIRLSPLGCDFLIGEECF